MRSLHAKSKPLPPQTQICIASPYQQQAENIAHWNASNSYFVLQGLLLDHLRWMVVVFLGLTHRARFSCIVYYLCSGMILNNSWNRWNIWRRQLGYKFFIIPCPVQWFLLPTLLIELCYIKYTVVWVHFLPKLLTGYFPCRLKYFKYLTKSWRESYSQQRNNNPLVHSCANKQTLKLNHCKIIELAYAR